ncbi:MAG: hypothetical protein OXG85_06695 [Chloroflexi bacterium]|nr:hypothetical protein [Chloroflexota bacterium]
MDIRLPLPAALRHRVESEEHLWAYLISLMLSPPVVWACWVYAIAATSRPDRPADLQYASLFAFAVCASPILFVSLMVRIGRIGDLHMRESRERYIPYSIAIIGGLCCAAVFPHGGADPLLYIATLVSIVELALMLVGTLFIHISFHAAGMASLITATALMFSFNHGLAFVPVLLLVVLARLVLKRHTGAQILLGVLIGSLTPFVVVAALGTLV